ncbi:MAG TPA: glycoside hydrolase family 15 protein [Solirubrobacterales bacterium]|nr:glycoside hydrolase family 15 protein [Solirubrobacterales bacterium]
MLLIAGVLAAAVVSGGSTADPRTPPALPGLAPPFLGTAVAGSGGLTAAVDAYGAVVDLRPGPAGRELIHNPAERQAAGTVPADTGIVPRVSVGGGPALPLWRADSVSQRYLAGTNVVITEASFGSARAKVVYASDGRLLGCQTQATRGAKVWIGLEEARAGSRLRCDTKEARRIVRTAEQSDRWWLAGARRLGSSAPAWAERMYQRSLLTLRALTDRRTGAVAAGARDGWAYVWPRDAGAAALAFAAAGYRQEARRVARFLLQLDFAAAARFHGDGSAVPGREAQGDASGWVTVAAHAAGLPSPAEPLPWRDRPDYHERSAGDYLANAIASSGSPAEQPVDGPISRPMINLSAHRPGIEGAFGMARGLVRQAGEAGSALDSAAAWGVRPFRQPALFPAIRRTLLALAADQTRFGITPGEDWDGVDPWSAPTAWSAWSLAALGERRQALRLLGALRRSATAAGALPERVDARTGIPRSTTPLAWSHAFAILALRQLWPN